MLLRLGSIEAVMLRQLLRLLKQRGFTLITLAQAESDPAYSMHPDSPAHWHGTFWEQMIEARHLAMPKDSTDWLAKLGAACR